jgi:hypothetical protein
VVKEGELKLVLKNGAKCGTTHRESIIRFLCDEQAGEGNPYFVGETRTCVYEFTWTTAAACPIRSEEAEADCEVAGFGDLSPLGNAAIEFDSEDGQLSFEFALCGAKKRKCGSGRQGACVRDSSGVWQSLGSSKGAEAVGTDLSYSFKGGDSCPNGGERSAVIDFVCDPTQPWGPSAAPYLAFADSSCRYSFVWNTALACTAVEMPCVWYDSDYGHMHDFLPLSPAGGDIQVNDEIELNLCRSVANADCPPGTAVCIKHGSEFVSHGHITPGDSIGSMGDYDAEAETFTVNYQGGKCPNSFRGRDLGAGTNRVAASSIVLSCDREAGTGEPELTGNADCTYTFKWKTCLACRDPDEACSGANGINTPPPPPPPSPPSPPTWPPTRNNDDGEYDDESSPSPPPSPAPPSPPNDSGNHGQGNGNGNGNDDSSSSSQGGGKGKGKGKGKGGKAFFYVVLVLGLGGLAYLLRDEDRRAWLKGLVGGGGAGAYSGYNNPNMGYNAPMLGGSDDEGDEDEDEEEEDDNILI